MMHPSLLKLIRLISRAKVRRLLRGLRGVKGIVAACFICGFFAIGLAPVIAIGFLKESITSPETIRSIAPLGMLAICVSNLLVAKPENGIPFLPAEVDFLFPGPFHRRELLAYKILGMLMATTGASILFSLFLIAHLTHWLAGFVGLFLILSFIQLVQVSVALVAATVAGRAFTRGRKLFLLVVGICLVYGLADALASAANRDILTVIAQFRSSWAGMFLLAPFEVFGRTLAAETYVPELLGWGSLGLLINAGLVLLVLLLDANFLETSVVASQKMYERLQTIRRGTVWVSIGSSKPGRSHRRLPQLPWWGGAGPIAWRQMSTARRGARRMFVLLFFIGAASAVPFMMRIDNPQALVGAASGMLVMFSLVFLPQMIAFDFRADVDRMETLKALPISSTAIVIGELLTPLIVATAIQIVLIAAVALLQQGLPWELLIAVVFIPPANLLVFGMENLMFLWYPYRQFGGFSDMQAYGRQMMIMLLKMLLLGLVAGIAIGLGGAAYWLAGRSTMAFAVVSWLSVCGLSIGLLPAIAHAYRQFDPSTDTPA